MIDDGGCVGVLCVQQLGGFRLPFITLGSLLVIVGFLSYFVLPSQNGKYHIAQLMRKSGLTDTIVFD